MDTEPYDEYMTRVEPAGGDPIELPAGRSAELAQARARVHHQDGNRATTWVRTWTPGDWRPVEDGTDAG